MPKKKVTIDRTGEDAEIIIEYDPSSTAYTKDESDKRYVKQGLTYIDDKLTAPFIELENNTSAHASLHVTLGPNFSGPYGAGWSDNRSNATVHYFAHKSGGNMNVTRKEPTATGNTWVYYQEAKTGVMQELVQAAQGGAPMQVFRVANQVNAGAHAMYYDRGGYLFAVLESNGAGAVFNRDFRVMPDVTSDRETEHSIRVAGGQVGFHGKLSFQENNAPPYASVGDEASQVALLNYLKATLVNKGFIRDGA